MPADHRTHTHPILSLPTLSIAMHPCIQIIGSRISAATDGGPISGPPPLPFSPSVEAVMCTFYQHALFKPWLRRSLTLAQMENGAKLASNYNQKLPKNNSQPKPIKQATTQKYWSLQVKNQWKNHLNSSHISENLFKLVQKSQDRVVHTIKLEVILVFIVTFPNFSFFSLSIFE